MQQQQALMNKRQNKTKQYTRIYASKRNTNHIYAIFTHVYIRNGYFIYPGGIFILVVAVVVVIWSIVFIFFSLSACVSRLLVDFFSLSYICSRILVDVFRRFIKERHPATSQQLNIHLKILFERFYAVFNVCMCSILFCPVHSDYASQSHCH